MIFYFSKFIWRQNYSYLIFFSLLFFSFFCKSTEQKLTIDHQKNWTKGKGQAQVYQNDTSLAKDRALRMAKKDAIRKKLGELIKSKTVTESGIWIRGELVAQSEGLVKDYIIISEHLLRDHYKIEILADVNSSQLTDQVQDLLDDLEKPIIFGVILETFRKKQHNPYYNHTLQGIEKFFNDKGFILNKVSSIQTKLSLPISISKVTNMIEKQEIKPDFDLLLFGESTCRKGKKIVYNRFASKMITAQLDISLSIFDIHTRRLIATISEQSAFPHINFEMGCSQGIKKKIIPKLANKLFKRILKKWSKEYVSGKSLFIDIIGSLSYKNLYEFQKILRNEIRGVVDIIERDISFKKKSLEIIYHGKMKDFIEEILHKKTNLSLKLDMKIGRRVSFSLK